MRKKIAFVSSSFYGQVVGGAEYQQFLLSKYLKKMGHRIFHIFIDNRNPISYESDFEIIRIKKRFLLRKLFNRYFFLDALKVYRLLSQIAPDVVIIRTGFAYVGIAAKYCVDSGCMLIWQIANRADVEPLKFKLSRSIIFDYIDKKFLEYGIKRADLIIGQANYQSDLLYQNYSRKCSLIVPNYHPFPEEIVKKGNPIKILWVANFKEVKRPDLFIKLAEKFKDYANLEFIMIGRSSRNKRLTKIVKKIQKIDNIEYKGELSFEDVNKILGISHILVCTSRMEGFPNIFIQAWMRKVPVVSLDIDPDDILKDNKIGFHSGSFQQLADDVERLISSPKLREEMGQRAREYAFRNFSTENMKKIADLIES